MTKEEFLDGLMKALASTGSQSLITENIRFYSSYIDDELSKGRSIGEIMEELGEPRLIANSIKVAAGYDDVFVGIDNENTVEKNGSYEENENYSDRKDNSFKTYNFSGNSLIIPIIIAIAVLVVIVAVVAAVFSFLAPVLLPVIGVLLLVAIIKGIFGKGNYKF